jgi:hypothetical protein
MDVMRLGRLTMCVFLAAAIGVAGAAVQAAAAMKVFLPEQFQPIDGSAGGVLQPLGLQGGNFWAPVSLPVGARVTKVVWYHWGLLNGSSFSQVYLNRVRTAMGYATSFSDNLFGALRYTYTGIITTSPPSRVALTTPCSPESDLVVRAGYRYNLWVLANSNDIVQGVKVFYEGP